MSTAVAPTTKAELIESKIDKIVAGKTAVSLGGMEFRDMGEVMEFAKLMSISGQAVPPHLRNQQGFCLAISIQALEWRMSPFAVANKSYVVNDRLCYESQLIHAVIEQRAPIEGRLRHSFAGAGENRTCTVTAKAKGDPVPLDYTSPPFRQILPKNSPLWKTKPDLQLYYNTSRDWARMYFPDVIMGVYSDEEIKTIVVQDQRISSLDQLTDRLSKSTEQPGESIELAGESIELTTDEPTIKPFADRLQNLTTVQAVIDAMNDEHERIETVDGDDATRLAEHDAANEAAESRIAEIKAARGERSNKSEATA